MPVAFLTTLLAAETPSVLHLGDHFRGENARIDPLSVGLVATLAVLAVTACWLIAKVRGGNSNTTINHPGKLLRELSQAHRLDTEQERLLHRMIRHYAIEPPARVFLEPERFQTALTDAEFQHEKQTLLGLKERLFAGGLL